MPGQSGVELAERARRKFVVTTALALVLAGGAYTQGHYGGEAGGPVLRGRPRLQSRPAGQLGGSGRLRRDRYWVPGPPSLVSYPRGHRLTSPNQSGRAREANARRLVNQLRWEAKCACNSMASITQ